MKADNAEIKAGVAKLVARRMGAKYADAAEIFTDRVVRTLQDHENKHPENERPLTDLQNDIRQIEKRSRELLKTLKRLSPDVHKEITRGTSRGDPAAETLAACKRLASACRDAEIMKLTAERAEPGLRDTTRWLVSELARAYQETFNKVPSPARLGLFMGLVDIVFAASNLPMPSESAVRKTLQ